MFSIVNQIEDPFDTPKKGQHFIKSAEIKADINFLKAAQLSENESFEYFVAQKWGSKKRVVCPECKTESQHYFDKKKKRWRCRDIACQTYFSLFSGTVFQNKKLTYHELLCFLTMYVIFPFGVSFETSKGMIDIQCKTAQVLTGKVREVLINTTNQKKLSGVVHMDGGHFGGKPRHGRIRRVETVTIKNHVESMLLPKTTRPLSTKIANDRRRLKNRRVVIVLREVSPIKGQGGTRTIVVTTDRENESNCMSLAMKYIEKGSTVITDENPAYNQFSKFFHHKVVEHAKEFAREDGVNSNQAESFFSRLRRYEYGVGLRIEPKYLFDIATEMAWREDIRRWTYGDRLSDLSKRVLRSNTSKDWVGYWQGKNRPGELIWSPEQNKPVLRIIDNK